MDSLYTKCDFLLDIFLNQYLISQPDSTMFFAWLYRAVMVIMGAGSYCIMAPTLNSDIFAEKWQPI
jgi:hypothetical protein